MTALIVGAGIAGPVTAMALARAGIASTVFEAWPRTDADVGSWLTVAPNGLDALRAIDAHEVVTRIGFPTRSNRMLSHTGRRLGDIPLDGGLPDALVSRTVKRATLHRALRDEAERRGVSIVHGKRLVDIVESADGVIARFEDGTEARGDVLVGADGVNSLVRRRIDPRAPDGRYVGLVNFGGYTPSCGLADEPGIWHFVFGKRAFFGYIVDPSGAAVWFVNVPRPQTTPEERAATSLEAWKAQLRALVADDEGPAGALIDAGFLELAGDNTHDLPVVPTWSRGRLLVLGDAAHAPSPSSGQGASMAMEDGVVLAMCLRDQPDHRRAFACYEKLRRARVERIVAQGARSSSSKTPGPIGRWLRDLTLPFVFRYVVTPKSLAWMVDHRIEWDRPVIDPAG